MDSVSGDSKGRKKTASRPSQLNEFLRAYGKHITYEK